MNEQELRKRILNGNKTERINFAVTPEMKDEVRQLAEDNCTSISSLISNMLTDRIVASKKGQGARK